MRILRPLLAITFLLALFAFTACGDDDASDSSDNNEQEEPTVKKKTATPAAEETATPAKSSLRADDLLVALLVPADVAKPGAEASLWRRFPEVSAAGYNIDPATADKGELVWVYEEWIVPAAKDGDPPQGRLRQAIQYFEDEASAIAAHKSHVQKDQDDWDAKVVPGDAVGDEYAYLNLRDLGDKATPYVATLRFRIGRLVGRIESARADRYDRSETMRTMAVPLASRMRSLLDGTLKAKPLPDSLAKLLPPANAGKGAGPLMATVSRPAEAWALIDGSGKPRAVKSRLEAYGATGLGWQAYGLDADKTNVITVTLFPMSNVASAEAWAKEFISHVKGSAGALDAGKAGTLTAFTGNGGEFYELQFAKGKNATSITCTNVVDPKATSPKCEAAVRKIAEAWYASLPE